jgi:hypothetical protein
MGVIDGFAGFDRGPKWPSVCTYETKCFQRRSGSNAHERISISASRSG